MECCGPWTGANQEQRAEMHRAFLPNKPSHACPADFGLHVSSPWFLDFNSLLAWLLAHGDHSLSPSHYHPQSGSSVFPVSSLGSQSISAISPVHAEDIHAPPWLASLMSPPHFSPMLESIFFLELLIVVGIFLEYPAPPGKGSLLIFLPL